MTRRALVLVLVLGFGLLAAFLCSAQIASAQDAEGGASPAPRVFVEVVTDHPSYYVHQPIRVAVRVGIEERALELGLVAMFRRPMDVPVQLLAPWFDELPGTAALEPVAADGPSFAVNDDVVRSKRLADREVDGRKYRVFEVARQFLPERAAEQRLDAPTVRFAYATRFEEDFVRGNIPVDRHDASVSGESLTVTVADVPAEGRPRGYTGAVGSFTLSASTRARTVRIGESFQVALRIEGSGNLASFDPPQLTELGSTFHVYGHVDDYREDGGGDDGGGGVRTITYDLSPLDPHVQAVPPLSLPHFDPGPPAAYRTASSEPVAIVVLPPERTEPPVEPTPPPATDTPPPDTTAPVTVAALLLLGGLVVLVLVLRAQARERAEHDPHVERVRAATATFHAHVAQSEADIADALAAYLAAHLHCEPAAVISPDLPARLEAAGVPAELAGRTASLVERLVARRYAAGGGEPRGSADAARALVAELDRAFA